MKEYPSEAPSNAEDMWETHRGIAIELTNRFHVRYPTILTFDEKLSHACIAMIKCMEGWKPEYKTRFVTYAYKSIRRELHRAISKELSHLRPGPIEDPGKYEITLINTDYQERNDRNTHGNDANGIHAQLFASEQVEYQNPEEIIEAKQRIKLIRRKLPKKYRKAFRLMIEKGYTYGEAAKAEGFSREAMRTAWVRCLGEMQDVFRD